MLDADLTAREVVMPGMPGLNAIVQEFGEEILNTDGTLDRNRLGALIFADQNQRQRLNHILHPFIIARQDEILRDWEREDPKGIGIVDAALMISNVLCSATNSRATRRSDGSLRRCRRKRNRSLPIT